MLPNGPDVQTTSLLTVGDSVNLKPDGITPYRLVGIPDGMGAYDNGDGTFTILLNHELRGNEGITRAHGAAGAFVSMWTVDTATLAVLHGEDLIQEAFVWNPVASVYEQSANETFERLCSGDLPALGALFNASTGLGTTERIYANGEETGAGGRAFAHIVTGPNAGRSYELPRAGNFSFENFVLAPGAGDTTVGIGLDDSNGGQIYVYVGTKTDSGIEVERAGLTNGVLYGLVVDGLPVEIVSNGLGGPTSLPFSLHNFGDVSSLSGPALQGQSVANAVTSFRRPEDGHFDPRDAWPNDFYWATTGGSSAPGRLWRLRFTDITNPALGGTIDMLLDGTEGVVSPDNVTVDQSGNILIQEDRGSSAALGRIWRYSIATGALSAVSTHNPEFFTFDADNPNFLTTNEESSGIIDAWDILGPGWFLFDVQSHRGTTDTELVQGGQILAMFVPDEFCGDGVINNTPIEQCDDGNNTPGDGCSENCLVEFCGDGITNNRSEQCDDGNNLDNDGCDASCITEFCGDGITNDAPNEECDDGNVASGDGCDAGCIVEFCGDSIVNDSPNEQCDDGNNLDGDGCDQNCVTEFCGDGILNNAASEECDDGNSASGDGCSAGCVVEFCGDGITNNAPNEECDDGNNVDGDGCQSGCRNPICGDGIIDLGNNEECDNGSDDPDDDCDENCLLIHSVPSVTPSGMIVLMLSLSVALGIRFRRPTPARSCE
jgi:cysteine-rich repeat protein